MGFSCTLLALAAVGLDMRSRNPGLAPPTVEVRDSGRLFAATLGATDGREGLVVGGLDAGRVAVEGLRVTFAASSPCSLAADAAVGAVKREGSPTGRVGDFGLGFLKAGGEVGSLYLVSCHRGALEPHDTYLGLVVTGFLFSVAAIFAFAAAVGAVAIDCRREVWLVFGFGAAALTGSFAAGFAAGLAAAADFETGVAALGAGAAAAGLALVGVFGATLGSGLLTGVLFDAEALVVEIAAGFLASSLPFVVGVPFALEVLVAGFGVFTAGSAGAAGAAGSVFEGSASVRFNSSTGEGSALPPETADASVRSAGFRDTPSCAPVVALSGFSAGISCTGAGVASCSFTGSSSTAGSSGTGASLAGASVGCGAPASASADVSGNSEPFMI